MIDPFMAMAAAAEQIRSGDVEEVELDWNHECSSGCESHLSIVVRRRVRHIVTSDGVHLHREDDAP